MRGDPWKLLEMSDSKIGGNYHLYYLSGERPTSARQAFRLSVSKWEFILAGLSPEVVVHERGQYTCGMCMLYFEKDTREKGVCSKCPIRRATGRTLCKNTPYHEYIDELYNTNGPDVERLKAIAQEELVFLQGLQDAWIKGDPPFDKKE